VSDEWEFTAEELGPTPDLYSQINALNWSTLKLVNESPRALTYAAEHEREDTEWMLLGRAIHCWALENSQFKQRYAIAPNFGDLRTKEGKAKRAAFAEDLGGREMLTAKQAEIVIRAGKSLGEHKVARKLLEGKREQIITWTHPGTGISCKGRIDVANERVVDLKSTSLGSVRQILSDAASRLYHGQGAWYHDGAILAGILRVEAPLPANVWVQNTAPFDVVCAEMTEETFEAGKALYEQLIGQYRGCQAANWWPGMAPEMVDWTLPKWAQRSEEQ
jgi:hypothetical protein